MDGHSRVEPNLERVTKVLESFMKLVMKKLWAE